MDDRMIFWMTGSVKLNNNKGIADVIGKVSEMECGGQRRDRTADAGLFRAALYH